MGSDGTSTLPRQELRYTDHGLGANDLQWSGDTPAWHLESDAQLADFNGDGLPDKLPAVGGDPFQQTIALQTGAGWEPDPDWSASAQAAATAALTLQLRATLVWPAMAQATPYTYQGQSYPQPSVAVTAASVHVDGTPVSPNGAQGDLTPKLCRTSSRDQGRACW